jgi:predicted CXXCH cytochrome family protein
MKKMKVTMLVAASALLMAAPAMAFHSGGVADCDGCHTMHNSEGGATMNGGTLYQAGPYLLQTGGGNGQASDACLNCHDKSDRSSYHISTQTQDLSAAAGALKLPNQRTPGGDFGWLKMNTNAAFGGHNVRGENHGLGSANASGIFTKFAANGNVGPGGTYPVDQLQCSSCHDPHGKYRRTLTGVVLPSDARGTASLPIMASGSYATSPMPSATAAVGVYRILGGVGYQPKSMSAVAGVPAFVYGPPLAVAPGTYNKSESSTQTKVAYGQGMSEWCANCHGTLLTNAGTSGNNAAGGHTHPAGAASGSLAGGFADSGSGNGDILGNYNAYVSSGNLGGLQTASYESLVPYEEGTGSAYDSTLQAKASSGANTYAGPTAGAQAMCLSCHRAHATGFSSMLRYDISGEFMTIQDTVGGATAAYSTVADINAWKVAAYNDKPASKWGVNQRVLCNKCHAKD